MEKNVDNLPKAEHLKEEKEPVSVVATTEVFDSILKQLDTVFKDKFESNIIKFESNLSPSQLLELNEKLELNIHEWKSTSFSEFKAHYDLKYQEFEFDEDDEANIAEDKRNQYLVNHPPEEEFASYMKQNGPLWTLQVEPLNETPGLIDFIINQLQSNKFESLILDLSLSSSSIDRILETCKHSSVFGLSFAEKQTISDSQVKLLIKCLNHNLFQVRINGKDLSDEMVQQLIIVSEGKSLTLIECPYYDTRTSIQRTIKEWSDISLTASENFLTEDIKKLIQQFANQSRGLRFTLRSVFMDLEWGNFFSEALSSNKVDELRIYKTAKFSADVLQSIILALRQNTSLKCITLEIEDEDTLREIINATNKTLTGLFLCDYSLSSKGFDGLIDALLKNDSLRRLFFTIRFLPDSDLHKGLMLLRAHNYSLVELYIDQPRQSEGISQLIQSIKQRNITFSSNKSQEQRQFFLEVALILLQADRQRHFALSSSVILNSVMAFLVPSFEVAQPKAITRCMDLLRSNLQHREWNVGITRKQVYGDTHYRIFHRWPASFLANESKQEMHSQDREKEVLSESKEESEIPSFLRRGCAIS